MKKLLLIPTTLVTALLAVAFISPTTASNAVRAVVPALHIVGASSVLALADSQQASTTADSSGLAVASAPNSTSPGSASPSGGSAALDAAFPDIPSAAGHSLATVPNENCGRFGNGFHGGKHLMVCPNRPFPPPANR
jgi:hypothetical protein